MHEVQLDHICVCRLAVAIGAYGVRSLMIDAKLAKQGRHLCLA